MIDIAWTHTFFSKWNKCPLPAGWAPDLLQHAKQPKSCKASVKVANLYELVAMILMFIGSCYFPRAAAPTLRRLYCSPGAWGKIRLSHSTHGWVALWASGIIPSLPHLTIQQWKSYIYTLYWITLPMSHLPSKAILRPDQLKRCREPESFSANSAISFWDWLMLVSIPVFLKMNTVDTSQKT